MIIRIVENNSLSKDFCDLLYCVTVGPFRANNMQTVSIVFVVLSI